MFRHKVDHQGRITLPTILCEKFNIKKGDTVEVSNNNTHIILRKYQDEYLCSITGKLAKKGIKIGDSFVSNEGLEMIKNYLEKEGK
jgi:AbrB family transcriptional regulator, transcriptional pleiotropic regulator of transition state genes